MNQGYVGAALAGRLPLRRSLIVGLLLLLVARLSTTAGAAPAVSSQQQELPSLDDTRDLETYIAGLVTSQLAAYHIPGAAVAVVKDGRLVFAKGYGYADREHGRLIDGATTLFRVASISKLLTWTAVMQLVEQGRLDLHADVNHYLRDFQIPRTFPQPITLAHLMTHTAGFEDRTIGVNLARREADLLPLAGLLARHMPARVHPPGELVAYTNYAVGLAGYIVEQGSDMPFDRYIDTYILQPLGMHRSTFQQPLPPELAADRAISYAYEQGAYREQPFPLTHIPPAAGLSSTASDLARFMIAHLQAGRLGEHRVLQPAAAGLMHRQHFTHDSRLPGWTLGFHELNINGQRLIGHAGAMAGYHSRLELLPEHNLGLFVAYNSQGGWTAQDAFVQAFLDRYFPAADVARPSPAAGVQERAARAVGRYRPTRSAYTTLEKLAELVEPVTVSLTRDGALLMEGYLPEPRQWMEIEPLVYRALDGPDLLVLRHDAAGHVTHLFLSSTPRTAFTRLAWYESPTLHVGMLGSCGLIFLSGVLAPARRWWKQRAANGDSAAGRAIWFVAALLSVLNLLFLFVLGVALGDPDQVAYGVPPLLVAALTIPLISTALLPISLLGIVLAWRHPGWNPSGRVHYVLVVFAALGFVWELWSWNLLGWRF